MIWAIGDVHGMFDPLKRIMTEIRLIERESGEPVEKLVFIGDYIDHGPSSKEALDLVRKPPYPAVALMGNHEDMAIRTAWPDVAFLDQYQYREMWLCNGARETLYSLADLRAARRRPPRFMPAAERPHKDMIPLPGKYNRFLRSLAYSHQETVEAGGRQVRFIFTHALPYPSYPLDDQLAGSHADFNRFLRRLSEFKRRDSFRPSDPPSTPTAWIESTPLWCRTYDLAKGYGGAVVVHGHSPTTRNSERYREPYKAEEKRYWRQFSAFSEKDNLPFLFSRSPETALKMVYPQRPLPAAPAGRGWGRCWEDYDYPTTGDFGVEAVNIDTGAVEGGALTAVGLSPELLRDGWLVFLTCPTSADVARSGPKVIRRSVKVGRLGGPEPAPKD